MVKRSPHYRKIRPRVVRACPSDTWSENRLSFVVFDLNPVGHQPDEQGKVVPQVLFALSTASGEIIAARVVEPNGEGVMTANDLVP